jgi:hypothetical protein
MLSVNGRLYHPAPAIGQCHHALLSNSLTLQLMSVRILCTQSAYVFACCLIYVMNDLTVIIFLQFAVSTEEGILMKLPMHDPVIIEERPA